MPRLLSLHHLPTSATSKTQANNNLRFFLVYKEHQWVSQMQKRKQFTIMTHCIYQCFKVALFASGLSSLWGRAIFRQQWRLPAILCRMGPFGTFDSLAVCSSGYFRRFIHIRIAVKEHLRKQQGFSWEEKLRGIHESMSGQEPGDWKEF